MPTSRPRPPRTAGRGRRSALAALLAAALLAGCSDDDSPEERASGDGGSVSVEETAANTLSAIVNVTTDAPSRVALRATAGDHEVTVPAPDDLATEHEVALVGLRPETDYEVEVEATDDGGEALDVGGTVAVTSGRLPADFPPIEATADRSRTAEGLTLISLKPWGSPEGGQATPAQDTDAPGGYLAVVDQDGFVVWYHATELGVLDARQLDNGNFLYTYDETVLREVDVLGRTVNELAGRVATELLPEDLQGRRRASDDATPMDTDSVHHDAGPLPNGNILFLSTEMEERTGPPQCGEPGPQATYPVIADVVVEANPETGEIVKEWPLFDIFDPFERPGEELCKIGPAFAPPNFFYPQDERDWTHGNSVVIDEERNALIVSLRHFNAVLAIRYEDDAEGPAGELLWELGPDGTTPLDGEPSYYQHAAEVLDERELLVYDNGNSRPGAALGVEGDDPPYSRAVIYEVDDSSDDPTEWSARQVWEHRLEGEGGRPVFTAFLGDVDALENGNILVTHGAIADERGNLNARVIEVVRGGEDDGDVVLDLHVGDDEAGWTVYRSERIPSLTR